MKTKFVKFIKFNHFIEVCDPVLTSYDREKINVLVFRAEFIFTSGYTELNDKFAVHRTNLDWSKKNQSFPQRLFRQHG